MQQKDLSYQESLLLPKSLPFRSCLPHIQSSLFGRGCRSKDSWCRSRSPRLGRAGLADHRLPSWHVVQGFLATKETRQTDIPAHV